MVQTHKQVSGIPVVVINLLIFSILIGCVLVAGCSLPLSKNIKAANSSTPTTTPSIITTKETGAPVQTVTSPETKKGLLNISITNYNVEPPAVVFVDNVSAGNVSLGNPLNLSVDRGLHSVRLCMIGACLQEDVVILSSVPTELDFGERLKQEVVSGQLRVSIGGYNAELPVFVDNATVGDVTTAKPLNLVVKEGTHKVKVCVGILCVNETVEIKFAQPVYLDFGEQLKKVAEFPEPTIRIVDTRQTDSVVTIDVEFLNPTAKDLTMTAPIELAYSYIDPQTHWRNGDTKTGTLTKSVKAGTSTVQSLNLVLTGGSAYIIEVPTIMDASSD